MTDRNELLKGRFGNTGPSPRGSRVAKMREEGEVSSGNEDEGIKAKSPNLEASHLSFSSAHLARTNNNRGASSSLYRPAPHKVTHPNYRSNYIRPPQFNKIPKNRNLSWKNNNNKRPLIEDDNNLVISFSDDESSDTQTNSSNNHHNGVLDNNSNLETLRNEIALKEKLLKRLKVGPTISDNITTTIATTTTTTNNNHHIVSSNNNNNNKGVLVRNGDIVLSKVENVNNKKDNVISNEALVVNEKMDKDVGAQLESLLELEEREDKELEQAQEQRRNFEKQEREALKAYRKAQKALYEATEKCNHLQKKRDLHSREINSLLLENSSTSVPPWSDKSDENAKNQLIVMSPNKDLSTNGSDNEERDSEDYELLEASLRSALVARYGNKPPLKNKNENLNLPHQNSILLSTQPPPQFPKQNSTVEHRENMISREIIPFIMPCCEIRNVFVHVKWMYASERNDGFVESRERNDEVVVRDKTYDWGADKVDLFWPFCIFELRGKCNDEECKYQHAKHYDWRKITNKPAKFAGVFLQNVPLYHIESYQSPAFQGRNTSLITWQYGRRGYRTGSTVPITIQRFLLSGFPSRKFSLRKLLEELPEPEKCLEIVLEFSPSRNKALVILSRAVEKNPKLVALWVVYLQIYYRKAQGLGKDDLFLYAVRNNPNSYDLWLMYIKSRPNLDQALNAHTEALLSLSQADPTTDKSKGEKISTFILDLYLQMLNLLCISGHSEKAVSRIFKLGADELLTKILRNLIVPDKCIFMVCGVYVSIYKKLPEGILELLELEKNLEILEIDWPFVEIEMDEIDRVLGFITNAFDTFNLVELDSNCAEFNGLYLKELQFLAIHHVKCIFAVKGLNYGSDLLAKYKKLYPNCVELTLISSRLGENCKGYEVVFSDCPGENTGIQCIWNQHNELLLSTKNFDLVRENLNNWFQIHGEFIQSRFGHKELETPVDLDLVFGFLNLSLYKFIIQNDLTEARVLVDMALKISGLKFRKFFLKEFLLLSILKENLIWNKNEIPIRVLLDFIGSFFKVNDCVKPVKEMISRKYFKDIKKMRVTELLNEFLGPVYEDYSLIINSILEICYGSNLIPEKVGIKELVNLVESVMQISPCNYRLGFSVCKFGNSNPGFDDVGFRFWACTVLVDSIFRSVPVAPEQVWVDGVRVLKDFKFLEISKRLCEQGLLVYPFSLMLWKECVSLSRMMSESGDDIVKAARERGIEVN